MGWQDDPVVGGGWQDDPIVEQGPDISRGQAFVKGAKHTADRVLDGITQMYLGARGEQSALGGLKQRVDEKAAAFQPVREKFPVVSALGEAAPMLAVPIGGGAGVASMIGRTALAAATPELLAHGSVQDRAKRGALAGAGGAVGGALGLGVGKLLRPAGTAAQGVSDDALKAAERIGYKPTAGQITQNPAIQNFENYLAKSPGSAGRMQAVNQANQTALNRAAAKAMGENADNLGEGVIGAARARMGQEFERLQQITGPDMARPEFMQALVTVDSANVARGPFASKKISDIVDKGLDLAAQGKITGKAYKEIHTELASASTAAFRSGDATLGQAIKSIRESMDDAAKASLGYGDRQAWDTVRKQWEAYKVLVKGNVAEAGDVSAARVASKVRADPRFRTGQMSGELADIARVGEAFKGVQNPNSGNLAQQMLYGGPWGLPFAAGNNVAARAYLSPMGQAYMTEGLLPVGPGSQFLLNRGGGLLGQPSLKNWLGAE